MSNYTHLHLHTEYSTLDGINKIDKLPAHAKSLGMSAVSITDHGTLAGHYKFFKECKNAGIKPLLGIEAYYTVGDRTIREADKDGENYYHLVLLAQNQNGLKNLFKLSSESYISGMFYKPRIDDALLADLSSDLIATSSCLGSRSSWLILNGQKAEAEKLLEHHAQIFKDRFFLELQLHTDEKQSLINKELIEISKRKNWPLVLTSDCHYQDYEDKLIHERALCIQTNDLMSNDKRFSFGDIDVHFASYEFVKNKIKHYNIPYEAISNTKYVESLIDSTSYFNDIYNAYPSFKDMPEGMKSHEALEKLSKKKLFEKFSGNIPQEYKDRLIEELLLIKKMGFSDYMLIQWQIIDNANKMDVMVGPGRGSAAGSLVAYALGITQVDPIKYNLLFSRFLNIGRTATPLIFTEEMNKIANQYIGCDLNHQHTHECNH